MRGAGVGRVLLVVALLLLVGCRGDGGATHRVMFETAFYVEGPQQARPADGVLSPGTEVTLVEEAGSHALVALPDGRRIWVAEDSLETMR